MEYIVLDLEWNQSNTGKEDAVEKLPFEIIEIGAIKLNNERVMVSEFNELIKPQVYHEMHKITSKLIHIQMQELERGRPFPEVGGDFVRGCGQEEYLFCTWGTLDLTELQRNMAYYEMPLLAPGPLPFLDVQKLFAIAYEERKIRRNLEYATSFLHIEKDIPFHRAFSDAYYTAKILIRILEEYPEVVVNLSYDTFCPPKDRRDEVKAQFDTYVKYISREFKDKTEAFADKEVVSSKCYLCHRNLRKKIKWFSANGRHYYCVAYCEKHGYLKGKIRVRKAYDGGGYIVKTTKLIPKEEAEAIMGNSFAMMVIVGLILTIVGLIFKRPMLYLFGASDATIGYADSYITIYLMGNLFVMTGLGMNSFINSQGFGTIGMMTVLLGAIANIILDPIFIFPLKMGVVGAGIATVIGQVAAGCLALLYLRRLKTVHIRREDLRPTRKLTCRILALGLPSLLTQMLSALVQITLNNLMRAYGAATVYGSDIALSVYGMMMKVYQIAHSMFVGVSSAIQPINGYNFGANHYARVQKTFHIASLIAVGISVVWFLIFMVFPRQIASCFVSDNALYLDCAQHCFRLYMLAFFLYGLHMTSASFFQGIGRPGKSLLIPLARQGCFLIPLALLLSRSFGLDGALLAAPIADALAFLLCLLLARWEFRSWRRKGWLCKGERKYRAS